jgi:hypothetical protein
METYEQHLKGLKRREAGRLAIQYLLILTVDTEYFIGVLLLTATLSDLVR